MSKSPVPQPDAVADAPLLLAIAAGDGRAFDAFVARHKRRLYRYLFHRVGDAHRAEDLLQEVFLRIFRTTARPPASADAGAAVRDVVPWMFTIAHRCVLDYLRTCRRRPLALASDLGEATSVMEDVAHDADPSAGAMAAESHRRVIALLDELPPEQQEVVALRVFADLSFAQIAEVTHLPLATVKSRMRYALEKLARRVTPNHSTDQKVLS